MQITLRTANWAELLAFLAPKHAAHGVAGSATEGDAAGQDSEDDEAEDDEASVWEILRGDPITGRTDSMIYNGEFGELFLRCEDQLPKADFSRLGRFIASFCMTVGGAGERFPVPKDADLAAMEWYAVLSPETLRELLLAIEPIDRRALRAAVRAVLVAGKVQFPSVGAFFDYFEMWVRAYRLAASNAHGVAIHIG